jgi:hypothetical protein
MQSDDRSPFDPPPRSYGLAITVVVCFAAVVISYLLATARVAENPNPPAASPSVRHAVPQPSPVVREGTPVPQRRAEPPPIAEAPRSPTTTIYLCKSYSGGQFWSDTTCHQQRATIDRMTSVPSDLPFSQQVAIAQGQANEAAPLYVSPQPGPAAAIGQGYARTGTTLMCEALNRDLENLDARARMPQSAQTQDWIRQRRMQVQADRVAQRC